MKAPGILCFLAVILTACAPEIRLARTSIQSQVNPNSQRLYFLDRQGNEVAYENATYYRVIAISNIGSPPILDYYMSGTIYAKMEGTFEAGFTGKRTEYSREGNVSKIAYYLVSKPNGAWTTFDYAGNITGQTYYDNGRQVATPEQIRSNQETSPAKQATLFRTAAPPPAYTGPCACAVCFGKKGIICNECGGDGKKCGTENRYVTEWVNKSVSKPVSVSEYDYSCKCYHSVTRYRYTTEMVQERKLKLVSTCDIACTRCNQSGRLACISCSGSGKGKCD